MSFWQSLVGNIFGFIGRGGRVATGDPPVGGNIQPRPQPTIGTANATNITFDDHMNFAVTATNNLYLAPGTDMTIQSGALGGDINIRTHYDINTTDRLILFDNNAGGTADNTNTLWNNGTTTAAIQNLRISEWDLRFQRGAAQTGQYLQGRINDHLNQQIDNQRAQLFGDDQLDAQRYAARIQGQPQINIANPYGGANVYRPFGGGLQGQPRHPAPPNLETPRAIAEVRGNKLLKKLLGDILYRHYEKNGYVDLPSVQKPGVGFRLRAHRRIGLLKRNRLGQWIEQKESLCIHAAGGYWVEGDQVGIHYMLCQCDEIKLWKQAIVHRVAA
jgi:hypothetical protein